MRWIILLFTCTVITCDAQKSTVGHSSRVQDVVAQLGKPESSDAASAQLRSIASRDPVKRLYIARHLPPVISRSQPGPVWINAVQLAGDLRAVEAVPVLIKALNQANESGEISIGKFLRLDDDPVGKALAEIGEPSVPALRQPLAHGAKHVRYRATRILQKIGSPKAYALLRSHVDKETDSDVRSLEQRALAGDPSLGHSPPD